MPQRSSNISCPLCNQSHRLLKCPGFERKSVSDRVHFVKVNRLCFNCLRPNHAVKDCKDPIRCNKCKEQHSSLTHFDRSDNPKYAARKDASKSDNELVATSTSAFGSQVYLPIIDLKVNSVTAHALLDNGSANRFIGRDLATK